MAMRTAMKTGHSHGRSSGATIRLCAGPSGKACPISLSPEPFAVNHLDRLGVGSKSSTSHAFTCTLNFPGTGRFVCRSQRGERDHVPQPHMAQWSRTLWRRWHRRVPVSLFAVHTGRMTSTSLSARLGRPAKRWCTAVRPQQSCLIRSPASEAIRHREKVHDKNRAPFCAGR